MLLSIFVCDVQVSQNVKVDHDFPKDYTILFGNQTWHWKIHPLSFAQRATPPWLVLGLFPMSDTEARVNPHVPTSPESATPQGPLVARTLEQSTKSGSAKYSWELL